MSKSTQQTGDAETNTAATRFRWTNDLLAGIVVLAQVGVLVAALFAGVDVPARLWDVFAVTVLLATTWAFGRETLTAVREFVWGRQKERRRQPARSRREARAPSQSTNRDGQPRDDQGRFQSK